MGGMTNVINSFAKAIKQKRVVLNVEEGMIMKIWIKVIENMRVLDFEYKSMRGEV